MSHANQVAKPRVSIAQAFAQAQAAGRVALMPFIPAGYPTMEATEALLPALEHAGASLIEIGFPFSDPIADGPTIQHAFSDALANKIRPADVFRTVQRARPSVGIPLVAMVSYSIVYRIGVDPFAAQAKAAGFDGLIIPDLPPPEAQGICRQVQAAGLDTILLVAPSTDLQRRQEIAALCSGFVYYLSISGVTGQRDVLPDDLQTNLRQLRTITTKPIAVGFGISTADHVKSLSGLADGAIVGSALVKLMQEHRSEATTALAAIVAGRCRQLLAPATAL